MNDVLPERQPTCRPVPSSPPVRRLIARLRRFGRAESAAVTSDFVMLSAAAIGLAIGATTVIRDASVGIGTMVETSLDTAELENITFN